MPRALVPVKKFRENHMRPDEQGFLAMFWQPLQLRGFRLRQDDNEDWHADPPLQYERGLEHLVVSQNIPGRLPDDDPRLRDLLARITTQDFAAIQALYQYLLVEGDDRAAMLAQLESSVPEDMQYFADTGDTHSVAGAKTQGDHAMIDGKQIAQQNVCRQVLVLFGVRQEML